MNAKDYFLNRRTVRRYSNREVSREMLLDLLEQASHAPTTGNMQLYSVVVTRDEEGKKALAPAHFNQPTVTSCRAILTFCADYNRFVKWCRQRDAEPGYNNFQSFVTALLDAALVAQQFVTAAEMAGLGTCYLGTTTYNAPMIAEALKLPQMVVPVTTVTVGWPEGEAPESDRLSPAAFVHEEVYNDYSPAAIDAIYAAKEARDDSRRFIEENGKSTLAQVFTDVRYTREACETFSRIYQAFILNQGF